VPLGRAKFLRDTGIKESDWYGRYWIRWGDALREAGFAPRKWQDAYGEEVQIEAFIGLMRELGRFPLHGDVRLKRRSDPAFPSHNTFNRFGSKSQFASRIVEYCSGRMGCHDVIEFCSEVRPSHEPDRTESKVPDEVVGFVYLLKSSRYYKIGKSNAIGRRERELAIQLPDKARTVHVIRTDDPSGIETYWHARFATKRKRGEWFELDGSDVKAFRWRTFMCLAGPEEGARRRSVVT
jgi:hypothetical protein